MQNPAGLRILIVDDNVASAQTLGWMLELSGHTITLAHEGETAMKHARDIRPQVILLDIGLPRMNGYELCSLLRKEPYLQDTVFIAQTGWGQLEHRQRSEAAGFRHHLVKPVQMDELLHLVDNVAKKALAG